MTTPNKEEIEKKAIEDFFKDQHQKGFKTSISPTTKELKESGYYSKAQHDLMRSEGHEFLSYLEEQAASLGYRLTKEKAVEGKQRVPFNFEIDIDEALRSGVFIAGGKGTTKSNLAMTIADILMKMGVIVKCFDISGAWLKSSVPNYVEIGSSGSMKVKLHESMIFDLSRLTPKTARSFIAQVLANEWGLQVSIPERQRKPICYVFEEVQTLIPQGMLRSNEAQVVLRLLTSGRNFKLSYIAITQRPALTDTSVFELTFQRYFSRMDGQNDLRKVANHIGFEKARELQNLKLGEFFYDVGSKTKWITTKEFHSSVKPQRILASQFANSEPIKKQAKEPTTLNSDVIEGIMLVLSLLGLGFVIGALLL